MKNFNLRNSGQTLFDNPEKYDGSLLYYKYFFIHDDIFDKIQQNNLDKNIVLKFISNEPN